MAMNDNLPPLGGIMEEDDSFKLRNQLTNRHQHAILPFTIKECSSYSSEAYRPENLLIDSPHDLTNRWQAATFDNNEFIIMELLSSSSIGSNDSGYSIPVTITMGKPAKKHASSVKDFVLYISNYSSCDNCSDEQNNGYDDNYEPPSLTHRLDLTDDTVGLDQPWRWKEAFRGTLSPAGSTPLYETFVLNLLAPTRYVKIEPKSTWESRFGYGLWYIELHGIPSSTLILSPSASSIPKANNVISVLLRQQRTFHRTKSTRLVLKYLRNNKLTEEFHSLSKKTGVNLQHPKLDELYNCIINQGNFQQAFDVISQMNHQDPLLFEEHLKKVPYLAQWTRLDQTVNNNDLFPGRRGGHQMIFDPITQCLYLYGGWDGMHELGDFWKYDIRNKQWICLNSGANDDDASSNSNNSNGNGTKGPGPRSCHKMALHVKSRRLYVLGKFVDSQRTSSSSPDADSNAAPTTTTTTTTTTASNTTTMNDFYVCDLNNFKWTCLDPNNNSKPPLLFDHQMVVDQQGDKLYVFGGKISPSPTSPTSPSNASKYGALYCYDMVTKQWTMLRDDNLHFEATSPMTKMATFCSRIGHSMLFDEHRRSLWIMMGQRGKEFLSDLNLYCPQTDSVMWHCLDTSRCNGPLPGFTQRSILFSSSPDPTKQSGLTGEDDDWFPADQILVMSGMLREGRPNTSSPTTNSPPEGTEHVSNVLHVFDIGCQSWQRVLIAPDSHKQPIPRFAHQLCYDSINQVFYLFGGNPGGIHNNQPNHSSGIGGEGRMNDFWSLKLTKSYTPETILQNILFLLKRQQYLELCISHQQRQQRQRQQDGNHRQGKEEALLFLQQHLTPLITQSQGLTFTNESSSGKSLDKEKSAALSELTSWLFISLPEDGNGEKLIRRSRHQLYERLISFLPAHMRPPSERIEDF